MHLSYITFNSSMFKIERQTLCGLFLDSTMWPKSKWFSRGWSQWCWSPTNHQQEETHKWERTKDKSYRCCLLNTSYAKRTSASVAALNVLQSVSCKCKKEHCSSCKIVVFYLVNYVALTSVRTQWLTMRPRYLMCSDEDDSDNDL